MECPNLSYKEKGFEKKSIKGGKTRRTYITWEDNATSCNISTKEDEEANHYSMSGYEFSASSVSSSFSMNQNYNTLPEVFKETHEEANISALSISRLKGLNNWLKNKHYKKIVYVVEFFLYTTSIRNVTLYMVATIYKMTFLRETLQHAPYNAFYKVHFFTCK